MRSFGMPKASAIAPCRSAPTGLNDGDKTLVRRVK